MAPFGSGSEVPNIVPNKITLQFCEICVKMAFASKMVHKIRYSGLQKMNILSTKQIM